MLLNTQPSGADLVEAHWPTPSHCACSHESQVEQLVAVFNADQWAEVTEDQVTNVQEKVMQAEQAYGLERQLENTIMDRDRASRLKNETADLRETGLIMSDDDLSEAIQCRAL